MSASANAIHRPAGMAAFLRTMTRDPRAALG